MSEALPRRAVACEHWRWMPGMLTAQTSPVGNILLGDTLVSGGRVVAVTHALEQSNHLPDLDDPATRGCLLELVREAWDDPNAYARKRGLMGWTVFVLHRDGSSQGCWPLELRCSTEAEALVAALEAAPPRKEKS